MHSRRRLTSRLYAVWHELSSDQRHEPRRRSLPRPAPACSVGSKGHSHDGHRLGSGAPTAARRGRMSTLAERIGAKASELGRRAIVEMYQNPFWQERFGARGREMSEKDSQCHLSYLMQALSASQPDVLT